jgi:FKBP-type peptidyl-prolyl cis-trans isomerase FkpA
VKARSLVWLALCLGAFGASTVACSKKVAESESDFKPAPPPPPDPGPAELQIIDDVIGKGKEAHAGDTVRVHYTGTLMNGQEFDSSRNRGTPFDFKLGTGAVIKGWDQGVAGMKVGGKRRLVIPQALGYGDNGSPPTIPPKAGLKFDVELLEVNPTEPVDTPPPSMEPDFDQEPDPDMGGPDPESP